MQHVFFSNKDKIDSPDVKLNALPIVLGSSGRGDNQFIKELTRGTCRNNPYRKKQTTNNNTLQRIPVFKTS